MGMGWIVDGDHARGHSAKDRHYDVGYLAPSGVQAAPLVHSLGVTTGPLHGTWVCTLVGHGRYLKHGSGQPYWGIAVAEGLS
jgi:hypothetical protein